MRMQRLWIMGLLILLFRCTENKPPNLPDILSETEDGFVDMEFAVTKLESMPSGKFTIDMAAMADSREVALRVAFGRVWKKGTLGGQITTFQGDVTFLRMDERSDRFIQFMDKVYAAGLRPARMKESIRFVGISLEGNPNTPRLGPLKIKLFYESEEEKEYAEAYLNVDLTNNKGWFNEKDSAYRSALVYDMKTQ